MVPSAKVIIVTGGSKGLGMGFVESLLLEGQIVYTYSRSETEFIKSMTKSYKNRFHWSAVDGKNYDETMRDAEPDFNLAQRRVPQLKTGSL